MTEAEIFFKELVSNIDGAKESKMFGALCFKMPNGKAGAMFWKDCIVVKLTGSELTEASALSGTALFDPMDGRPMKEWLQIPFEHKDKWVKYAGISAESVKNIQKKAKH